MRAIAIFAALCGITSSFAGNATNSLQQFSPKFSTNTQIVWAAPTNQLPKTIWIYKRLPPRPFSGVMISNAIALASLQGKAFPTHSTNSFFVWSTPNPCGMSYDVFSIEPASGTISFSSTNQNLLTNNVPDGEVVVKRAFECADRFGLNSAELAPRRVYGASNAPGCDPLTTGICGRGVFLARKLDGFCFFGDTGNGSDGFSIELGSRGQIRSFSLVWPNLERFKQSPCLSPKEIVRCIREQRILVVPGDNEQTYFQRLKMLAGAKTFTVTRITPVYGEGIFGEMPPTNNVPAPFFTPFAELQAEANFGTNKSLVRLLSPLVLSEKGHSNGNK
jgi:hypothetical protein